MIQNDDIFARPPRRSVPLPQRQTCAVCGLRSETIVCAMCAEQPASSIAWLEKLPAKSAQEQKVLDMLRGSPPLTFSGIPLAYWREEVRLNCAVSLDRLAKICTERGADFDRTVAGLKGE